jgi:streptomycin 6-kinase
LPAEFVNNTLALCGDEGKKWLRDLPEIIKTLEKHWSIKTGPHFSSLSFNYVASASCDDGTPAVLKIALPLTDTEIFGEARFLDLIGGEGAVRLLQLDRRYEAMLVERAVPGVDLKTVFNDRPDGAVNVAVEILRKILRPPPEDTANLVSLDDWFDGLKRAQYTDFPKAKAKKALDLYEKLSADSRQIFLLHGDLHHTNILSAEREPYLLIDPKGMIGHVGYDIAVFLNNHHWWLDWRPGIDQFLKNAVGRFAEAFEIEPRELREWAFMQLVLSAWWQFDEMGMNADEQLALSDIWNV